MIFKKLIKYFIIEECINKFFNGVFVNMNSKNMLKEKYKDLMKKQRELCKYDVNTGLYVIENRDVYEYRKTIRELNKLEDMGIFKDDI